MTALPATHYDATTRNTPSPTTRIRDLLFEQIRVSRLHRVSYTTLHRTRNLGRKLRPRLLFVEWEELTFFLADVTLKKISKLAQRYNKPADFRLAESACKPLKLSVLREQLSYQFCSSGKVSHCGEERLLFGFDVRFEVSREKLRGLYGLRA